MGTRFAYILLGHGSDLFFKSFSPADDAASFALMAAILSAMRRSPARSKAATCSRWSASNLSTARNADVF